MILSDEDLEFVKHSKDCINKGLYSDGARLTQVYNKVFEGVKKPVSNTSCGSCIRRRICELYDFVMKELEKVEPTQDENGEG